VTSGRRDKQIQVYDPAIAGKQAIVQKMSYGNCRKTSNGNRQKLGKLVLPPSRITPPCSPPSTNRHTLTPMAYLLMKPQQLAPTMGQIASGARIRAGSAFAGIGDTVAIGRVPTIPASPSS
jgi:hypothetical protein